jgi:hypothetical protein
MIVEFIAERYWPRDPDSGGAEAQGLNDFFRIADALDNPTQEQLENLAESLPNTRKVV